MVIPCRRALDTVSRHDFHGFTWVVAVLTALTMADTCAPVNHLTGLSEKLRGLETELGATNYASLNLEPVVREADSGGAKLIRVTVGRPFVFSFNVMTFNITGEFVIRWQHNGIPRTYVNCTLNQWQNDSSGDFALLVQPALIEFTINKISPRTLGSYQFSYVDDARRAMHSNTSILRPVYTPRDVFHPPMENVTAVVGETVNFRCYVTFNVSETEKTWDRIIWRHGDRIIFATKMNLMSVYQNLQDAARNYEFAEQAVESGGRRYRLIIKSAGVALAGRYECWFKPDDQYQDWVVQSAFLYVSKN